jgi:hypothetical protein
MAVAGLVMLVGLRHVYPQLHAMESTSLPAHLFTGGFIVNHAAPSSKPLHVVRPHTARIPQAVLVFRAAFKQQSKRFDPGVRVSGRALGFAWPNLDRTEMIEEDEGAYGLEIAGRDRTPDLEAVTVCTENLNPTIMVMKSAKDGA